MPQVGSVPLLSTGEKGDEGKSKLHTPLTFSKFKGDFKPPRAGTGGAPVHLDFKMRIIDNDHCCISYEPAENWPK